MVERPFRCRRGIKFEQLRHSNRGNKWCDSSQADYGVSLGICILSPDPVSCLGTLLPTLGVIVAIVRVAMADGTPDG